MSEQNTRMTTGDKKYNPTVTAFFSAPKFLLKDTAGNPVPDTAYISAVIDEEAFQVIQKNIQLGTKLLFRQSPRLNRTGGKTYYLEVLPPMANAIVAPGRGRSTASEEDV